jgi:two-component system chemotaxis response regulator CheB
MERIRTLLIDDSALMRKMIGDIIRNDASLELVGVANNGRVGGEMAISLKPDVVVTDMVMPDYDGMYLVKLLMEKHPIPIILLSSLEKSNVRIFDALKYGAFEFIDKPASQEFVQEGGHRLIELIREASRTDITLLKAKQLAEANSHAHTFAHKLNYDIVAIGASTGGPGAVESIINNLPRNLNIPVVVVQHMPARFLESFASRLNEHSPIPVQLANMGDVVRPGHIYIAPGDVNTYIETNFKTNEKFFTQTTKKYPEFNNPSVDCMFESIGNIYRNRSIGVILTGMGRDGTVGLKRIKDNGGFTIGQDEDSSIVYGMPRSAFEQGAVTQVVKLNEISGFIVSCL